METPTPTQIISVKHIPTKLWSRVRMEALRRNEQVFEFVIAALQHEVLRRGLTPRKEPNGKTK
jgi:hypothetical protein